MKIKIKRIHSDAVLPEYAHGPEEDAGLDLRSVEEVVLRPGNPYAVATGLVLEIPPGFEGQVRPRSGLALRHAITVPNAPGTIDPGYRGEVKVILLNLGREDFVVRVGDRIAQLVLARYESVEWEEAEPGESARGTGGFGSSGRN